MAACAVALACALAGCGGSSSSPSPPSGHAIQSIFQDDQYLLYAPTPVVASTLTTLTSLGVDTIRATVLWHVSAPQADSPTEPAGFNASDPAAYPPAAFAVYDRLLELARARGIVTRRGRYPGTAAGARTIASGDRPASTSLRTVSVPQSMSIVCAL